MSDTPNRVPAGVPAGGQFAPETSAESGVCLTGGTPVPGPDRLSVDRPAATAGLARAALADRIPEPGSQGEKSLQVAYRAGYGAGPGDSVVGTTNDALAEFKASGGDPSAAWKDMTRQGRVGATRQTDEENLRWAMGAIVTEHWQQRATDLDEQIAELDRQATESWQRVDAETENAYRLGARRIALTTLGRQPDARYLEVECCGDDGADATVLDANGRPVDLDDEAADEVADAMHAFAPRQPSHWEKYAAARPLGTEGSVSSAPDIDVGDGVVDRARLDLAKMLNPEPGAGYQAAPHPNRS